MTSDPINTEQIREIAQAFSESAAQAAVRKLVQEYPHFAQPAAKVEIPPSMKLAGGIITALLTAAVIASCFWIVTTLNELQLTVREISTRQITDTTGKEIDELKVRVTALERKVEP